MDNILHLKAPGDWINDPNGFIYFKGKYHLFYQYFPCAPMWGTMHWGHAVSEDLVHWTHLGVALYPTKAYDRNGIFSGSAIENNGMMQIFYTAVRYLQEEPENIHGAVEGRCEQSQATICSEDGFSFDNRDGKSQIIPPITDENIGDAWDCRDPKVWKENGRFYMCLGSTYRKTEGVLLLYSSEDGINWNYLNRLQDKRLGCILECPDVFSVDGKYILVCSPIGIMEGSEYPANESIIQNISFNPENGDVELLGDYKFLDYGMDLYAPQSNLDSEGRRTVIAWVRMPIPQKAEDNEASSGRPWNGMMALPRVVSVRDGHVYTSVHPNVRAYFDTNSQKITLKNNINGTSKEVTQWIRDGRRRIVVSLAEGEHFDVSGFDITIKDGCVCTDRSKLVPAGVELHTKCATPYVGNKCELEIYEERNLVEVFVNDGQYVVSNVLYRAD